MQKSSQRLDSFISESTRGKPSPIPEGEDMGGDFIIPGIIGPFQSLWSLNLSWNRPAKSRTIYSG